MSSTSTRRACGFVFLHKERTKDQCSVPAIEGYWRCVWHEPRGRPEHFDFRHHLVEEIRRSDHWLEGAQLNGLDLERLDLRGAKLPDAQLANTNLMKSVLTSACLDGANLFGAKLHDTRLGNSSLVKATFREAIALRTTLTRADCRGADLTDAQFDRSRLSNTRLEDINAEGTAWGVLGEFEDCQYEAAASVFHRLSDHYRAISELDASEHFYFLEMTALHAAAIETSIPPLGSIVDRLKSWLCSGLRPRTSLKWLAWGLHRWIWGYAVRPWRTLAWIATLIAFFGIVVFPIVGVSAGNEVDQSLLGSIALSFVTFSTLGYGNRRPQGELGELLGGVEALLGVLLTSVFVVALATKYMHRH